MDAGFKVLTEMLWVSLKWSCAFCGNAFLLHKYNFHFLRNGHVYKKNIYGYLQFVFNLIIHYAHSLLL